MSLSNIGTLPIIDWELGKRLAGNQIDLAKDMIAGLLKSLPDDFAAIKHLAASGNNTELLKQVHKLHGAVAYCGTPRLKSTLAQLELLLKSVSSANTSQLMQELENEVHALIEEHNRA